jgi:hypothetical protein
MAKQKPQPGQATRFKKSPLTDAQKAANVAMGLTPTGRIPIKRASRKGVDRLPDYPKGDYRCTGYDFTPARKNAFLEVIKREGLTSVACVEIGVHPNTVSRHRTDDHVFRDAMDEAFRQHGASLVQETHRRAVAGVTKPVYGSQGPGAGSGVVGFVTEFSDRLLLALLKKYDPDFKTVPAKVEVTTNINGGPKGDVGLKLEDLSPESRADLKRILERELERREQDGEARAD